MNEKKEYIDREALIKDFELMASVQPEYKQSTILGMVSTIKNRKAADVAQVVHGHWVNIVDYGGGDCVGYCSVCKAEHASSNPTALRFTFAYCRWCGAKMDGGNENDKT